MKYSNASVVYNNSMPSTLDNPRKKEAAQKPKRLSQQRFSDVSERLIERDFFPQIYKKRMADEVIDLTESSSKLKKAHADLDPLRLAKVGLDEFNHEFIAKPTVDLQQSLSNTKRNRNERLHGITDVDQLNPLMFNHPGLSVPTSNRRPRINFDNTRFPEGFVFEEPRRRSVRPIAPANTQNRSNL